METMSTPLPRLLAASATASSGASKSGQAFVWGFVSAVSLTIGAWIGITRLPSKVTRAALMAFGGGALIEALSVELFAHILATAKGDHSPMVCELDGRNVTVAVQTHEQDPLLIFLAVLAAICGGLVFAGLDRLLSNYGAALRKVSTVRAYVGRLRYALMGRLIARLRLVPMFEVLSQEEMERLARSMVKERYAAGQVIFEELGNHSPIFFVMSGRIELSITTKYLHGTVDDRRLPIGVPVAAEPRDGPKLCGDWDTSESPAVGDRESPASATAKQEEDVVDLFQVGPNDIFGEMSLFTGDTVKAQAVAATPACLLKIPTSALHRLLASNRRLQDFVAMTAIDRLRETEVFRRATPSTVARIVSFMRQAEFEAGDVLFYDIDALCPIYFVVLGRVEVVREDADGAQKRHFVYANDLLGTEHLVLGTGLRATATALERTTVLIVQRSDIDKLCERDERFRQSLMHSALGGGKGEEAELDPPEGTVGPAKYGISALEDLGWRRMTAMGQVKQPSPVTIEAHGDAAAPAEPPSTSKAHEAVKHAGLAEDRGEAEGQLLSDEAADVDDLIANATVEKHGDHHSDAGDHEHGHGVQAAIMIWLGILIDAVPESVVMGILVNTSSFSTLLAFVVGVFLANLPEAMSSAGTMALHGMRKRVIMLMWTSITVMTGIGACVGAIIFPPDSKDDPRTVRIIACIEGLCGGAMLTMIANTVLPEAFEQGGNVTGLSCLLGFLVAISVSALGAFVEG